MKIAIIGAGATGLVSAKYALEQGFQCDVFEQTGVVGGTWVYTEQVGTDENGLLIHSSMYTGLKTNLPKEVMAFLDFPYPDQITSYVPQSEVVDYFNSFADQFNLRTHIQFHKCITRVSPLPATKWNVTIQDAKTKMEESKDYDAVLVCSGHFRDPILPEILGQNLFKGPQWHSHNYRTVKPFENKKVLIIGSGPSGQDISLLISKVAERVFISHRGKLYISIPENVIEKPVVKQFEENGAVFDDGTQENFDMILYCTGYKYTFPFLTEECGIKVDNNYWVYPLYKHIVNIEYPTMCFVGLPYMACVVPMFDIQARFALANFGKKFTLPSKEDMLKELDDYMTKKREHGIPKRHAHQIGEAKDQQQYFDELAQTAGIRPMPRVISNIFARVRKGRNLQDCFKIVDDENFIQIV